MSETEVLARARKGDRNAFAQIITPVEERLYRVAFLLTGNREKAQDLLQEVFLESYLSLPRFSGRSSFYTFAYRILIHHNHKRARREKARRPELLYRNRALPAAPEIPPDRALQRKEMRQWVRRTVSLLPAPYQEVIVMYYLDQYSCAEISEKLRLKEGTVKSRLARGRRLLKNILEEK